MVVEVGSDDGYDMMEFHVIVVYSFIFKSTHIFLNYGFSNVLYSEWWLRNKNFAFPVIYPQQQQHHSLLYVLQGSLDLLGSHSYILV